LSFSFTIDERDCGILYGFLKGMEMELNPELETLLLQLEAVIFENLSIEEVEALVAVQKKAGGFV
jgi:hypothetical protein